MIPVRPSIVCSHSASLKIEIVLIISPVYCAVQKNSVPAAAGAVATSNTVVLLNRVNKSISVIVSPVFWVPFFYPFLYSNEI